jgi:hypothetical protein
LYGHPIFAQLLSLFPKEIFEGVIEQEGSDRYFKKLKTMDHFIIMFYAVLTKNGSLREVCKNIGMIILKLIPFGMEKSYPREARSRTPTADETSRFLPYYI